MQKTLLPPSSTPIEIALDLSVARLLAVMTATLPTPTQPTT
jgi:P2-related tail formation protein